MSGLLFVYVKPSEKNRVGAMIKIAETDFVIVEVDHLSTGCDVLSVQMPQEEQEREGATA